MLAFRNQCDDNIRRIRSGSPGSQYLRTQANLGRLLIELILGFDPSSDSKIPLRLLTNLDPEPIILQTCLIDWLNSLPGILNNNNLSNIHRHIEMYIYKFKS